MFSHFKKSWRTVSQHTTEVEAQNQNMIAPHNEMFVSFSVRLKSFLRNIEMNQETQQPFRCDYKEFLQLVKVRSVFKFYFMIKLMLY